MNTAQRWKIKTSLTENENNGEKDSTPIRGFGWSKGQSHHSDAQNYIRDQKQAENYIVAVIPQNSSKLAFS